MEAKKMLENAVIQSNETLTTLYSIATDETACKLILLQIMQNKRALKQLEKEA